MAVNLENLIRSIKGISGTGDVAGQVAKLLNKEFNITLEPGDFVQASGDGENEMVTYGSAPIAFDLWYLFNFVNQLDLYMGEEPGVSDYDDYFNERMAFVEENIPHLRPMRGIRDQEELIEEREWDLRSWEPGQWKNKAPYFLQMMAFENWVTAANYRNPSDGPLGEVNEYCGYLTFPAGQLGVIETISIMQETAFEADGFELTQEDEILYHDPPQMFPPRHSPDGRRFHAGKDWCFGRHIIEAGYETPKDQRAHLEYPASQIDPADYGKDTSMKLWFRYWIHKEDTLPVPGEFIGILCKPVSVPPHVWWFQESSPFIYTGHWMETGHLTSGVVTEVTREAERTDGGIGDKYKVKIQGLEVTIYPSDFLEYEVDDRVGIVKISAVAEEPATESYKWTDQTALTDDNSGNAGDEYMIIPIEFYQEN